VLVTWLLVLLAATSAFGQSLTATTDAATTAELTPVVSHDADGRVVVRATRIKQPLKVDGRLDEAAYAGVASITEFIQQEPQTGAPATERTEAWVLFDDNYLYLACRCWTEHPS